MAWRQIFGTERVVHIRDINMSRQVISLLLELYFRLSVFSLSVPALRLFWRWTALTWFLLELVDIKLRFCQVRVGIWILEFWRQFCRSCCEMTFEVRFKLFFRYCWTHTGLDSSVLFRKRKLLIHLSCFGYGVYAVSTFLKIITFQSFLSVSDFLWILFALLWFLYLFSLLGHQLCWPLYIGLITCVLHSCWLFLVIQLNFKLWVREHMI